MNQSTSGVLHPPHPVNGGKGVLSLFFGAAILPPLHALLLVPIDHQPWSEMAALMWIGAVLWVIPFMLLLGLFGGSSMISAILGSSGTATRNIRTFFMGFLLVAPPLWTSFMTWAGVEWRYAPVVSVVISFALIPFLGKIPGRSPKLAGTLRSVGWIGFFACLFSVWNGPINNHIKYGQFGPPLVAAEQSGSVTPVSIASPDVFLISIDTLRADAILGGKMGADTPFLDQLRAEGTWAEFAWSSSNRTVPGHGGMLTGRGSLEHGIYLNNTRLDESLPRLSVKFQEGGYRTMGVVSNPLMRTLTGFEYGFDQFDDALVRENARIHVFLNTTRKKTMLGLMMPWSYYRRVIMFGMFALPKRDEPPVEELSLGGLVTKRSIDLMDEAYAEDQATFFFLHYMDPHEPYVAPEGYHGSRPGDDPIPRYLEEVDFIDDCIERVVTHARQSGRPFVLLFTSDHGEHLGEHGYWGHANTLYNQNLHVPFIVYGDGVPKGVKIDDVGLEDVAPTLLARAGLAAEGMYGRNVLDPNVEPNGVYFARDDKYYSAVVGDYKWISPVGWKDGKGRWTASGSVGRRTQPKAIR